MSQCLLSLNQILLGFQILAANKLTSLVNAYAFPDSNQRIEFHILKGLGEKNRQTKPKSLGNGKKDGKLYEHPPTYAYVWSQWLNGLAPD